MAKKSKKVVPEEVEEVVDVEEEEEDIDLEDLDLDLEDDEAEEDEDSDSEEEEEDEDNEEEEDEEEEEEEEEEPAPPAEPAKKGAKGSQKAAAKKEAKSGGKRQPPMPKDAVVMEGDLTTKEVSEMVGVTPRRLRQVLREKFYADGKFTRYGWARGSKELRAILDYFQKASSAPRGKKAEGEAVLNVVVEDKTTKGKKAAKAAKQEAAPVAPAKKKGKK